MASPIHTDKPTLETVLELRAEVERLKEQIEANTFRAGWGYFWIAAFSSMDRTRFWLGFAAAYLLCASFGVLVRWLLSN